MTTASERARVEALGIELGERATRIPGGLAVSRALGDHFLKATQNKESYEAVLTLSLSGSKASGETGIGLCLISYSFLGY